MQISGSGDNVVPCEFHLASSFDIRAISNVKSPSSVRLRHTTRQVAGLTQKTPLLVTGAKQRKTIAHASSLAAEGCFVRPLTELCCGLDDRRRSIMNDGNWPNPAGRRPVHAPDAERLVTVIRARGKRMATSNLYETPISHPGPTSDNHKIGSFAERAGVTLLPFKSLGHGDARCSF